MRMDVAIDVADGDAVSRSSDLDVLLGLEAHSGSYQGSEYVLSYEIDPADAITLEARARTYAYTMDVVVL